MWLGGSQIVTHSAVPHLVFEASSSLHFNETAPLAIAAQHSILREGHLDPKLQGLPHQLLTKLTINNLTSHYVHYREVVLSSEVKMYYYNREVTSVSFIERFFYCV